MPTTGSLTIRDIGQAETFALSAVQGRPTQCRHVNFRSDKYLESCEMIATFVLRGHLACCSRTSAAPVRRRPGRCVCPP
jgi:hypothetical protein